jgi:hypothetical protein
MELFCERLKSRLPGLDVVIDGPSDIKVDPGFQTVV